MLEKQVIASPGLWSQQIVYLDFDGENTQYNNADLGLNFDVTVKDSGMSEVQKQTILAGLSEKYKNTGIVFTLERPEDDAVEYSTVYIGESDDFKKYGNFAGLAETIDKGNRTKNDDAFVFANSKTNTDTVISVIDHEVGHIAEGMVHQSSVDNTLEAYAAVVPSEETYPDLIVPEISVSSASVRDNQAVNLSFTIKNQGETAAEASYAGIYDNGELLDRVSVAALSSGQFRDYTYTIAAGRLSIGNHALYVVADDTDAIRERDESSNTSAEKTVTVTQVKPDLYVSAFSVSKTSITTKDSLKVSFTIKNKGTSSSGGSVARLYDGNTLLKRISTKGLAAGAGQAVSYTIAAGVLKAGSHSLRIVADAESNVSESNENNNTSAEKTVTVTSVGPDLYVSAFGVAKTAITTEDSLRISFTIKNMGISSSGGSVARLYDGDKLLKRFGISGLASRAGYVVNYTIAAGVLKAGSHSLRIVADAESNVSESDETNNNSPVKNIVVSDSSETVEPVSAFSRTGSARISQDSSDDNWKNLVDSTPVEELNGWVGAGDNIDYFKVATQEDALLNLSFDAATLEEAQSNAIQFGCLNSAGDSIALVWNQDGSGVVSGSVLASGEYYIGVSSANENSTVQHMYNIQVEFLS